MRDLELTWKLVYTKSRAEEWAEINLRKQGLATLFPLVRNRSELVPLFPRYLFVGHLPGQSIRALQNTLGVLYVVCCGAEPARVPDEVLHEIRTRMDAHGIVTLDEVSSPNPLFARRQRERERAIALFAAAGFRVRAA